MPKRIANSAALRGPGGGEGEQRQAERHGGGSDDGEGRLRQAAAELHVDHPAEDLRRPEQDGREGAGGAEGQPMEQGDHVDEDGRGHEAHQRKGGEHEGHDRPIA